MSKIFLADEGVLRRVCEPVRSVREGGEIARKLWAALGRYNKGQPRLAGVGLAAPQIGISKQVCVIDVGTPTVLMNPWVVERSENLVPLPFKESCLSFPGQQVATFRYLWVEVETLNAGQLSFGLRSPESSPGELMRGIVAQHEIAHCFGLLIFDFASDDESYPEPLAWHLRKTGA